jgi:hypothetical protein
MGHMEPQQNRSAAPPAYEDCDLSHDNLAHEKGGNTRDEVDMSRMGKKQELRVSFDSLHLLWLRTLTRNSVPSSSSPSWAS